jgi:adenylate cyclase
VSFFEDLKRRNVIRVAAAYAFVAWLVIQVAETVFPLFGFGDEPARIVVILVAIGFPLALIFSWVYEFTPDGLKLERDIDPSRSSTQHSSKKLDRTIIVVLTLALGYFVIEKFIFNPPFGPDLDPSVAVLPFEDMSPNGDQGYFGNGMAEQLRDELARLDGLRVAPRASTVVVADESLSAIAEKLGVATIVEGSIRQDGDQVRITAQLTNIAGDEILWSEIYDRKLENVFAIQEDIATEVSGALGVTLGVGGVNAFRGAGTRNFEAYELYLQNPRTFKSDEAIRHLSRAIELDPNYAAAMSSLAFGLLLKRMAKYPGENRENDERAYALVLRALELEPESAQSNALLGIMLQVRNDWIGAEEAHLKSLSLLLDQQNLNRYGGFLLRTGHSAVALEQYEKAEALEPLTGIQRVHFDVAMPQGRFADARVAWARRPTHLPNRGGDLTIALHVGDSKEIKAIMAAKDPTEVSTIELYAPVLKVFDSREMVLSTLRAAYADSDSLWPTKLTDIALLAAYFGDEELALQTIREEVRLGSPRFNAAWYPLMADVRKSQGFKDLVTELNLVEYWRASGWPDRCRALGADDFTCW